jgi:hypothetical protein
MDERRNLKLGYVLFGIFLVLFALTFLVAFAYLALD